MTASDPPAASLAQLNERIVACARCPRLRHWCSQAARQKRPAFRDQAYHARPVPNFGQLSRGRTRLLIVGLAPAAHGANRTGRMFTGDRSGDFLYARLHETGFANQPEATDADDGLKLMDAVITAACHCAPPDNKPTGDELANCADWLRQTLDLMPRLRVIVTLGKIAHDAVLRQYRGRGWIDKLAECPFAHAAEYRFDTAPTILCSYHPSQQNTFTGRLTAPMLRKVFHRARRIVGKEG